MFCCFVTDLPKNTSSSFSPYAIGPNSLLIPYFVTIFFAIFVTISISEEAPDVTLSCPKIISSAILPPIATAISEYIFSLVIDNWSLSGNLMTIPKALPLGIIVALCIGSDAFSLRATIA